MQLSARIVLDDVISAYDMLETESDPQKFRIMWIAAISLCRSVGQVLNKIDSKRSLDLSVKIEEQWREIKANRQDNLIFHEFIEKERNLILKEYEVGYISGSFGVVSGSTYLGQLDEGLYSPIASGEYEGEDCRDVLKQAIDWWIRKITKIEQYAH
ncbi:hypothetical protein [Shewanella xiamenensis]|uniref:hypothetical protein n=1 Tax=Shewanella xiamenensis TaxID=332186 RepID=UPI000DAF81A0|nr:hypothetical protein [Shewanella xiamenensis]PZP38237.1 MAG: hypothetical protein DI594_00510 [Shewanella oneidensis]MBW0279603.1 hypothetical protein [Shewanella xiamenensis]MCT8862164.1 hypothetical protein [Shewanella xiamenensis]MCT8871806.1 hypothetical protein [Shewanella xiamenensis]MCT8875393.1 hypothetical protein [Shewanella xiamenensis]